MIGLIARQCSISSATSRCWRPSIGPTECTAPSPIEGRRVLRRLCRSTGPVRNSRHRQQRQHHQPSRFHTAHLRSRLRSDFGGPARLERWKDAQKEGSERCRVSIRLSWTARTATATGNRLRFCWCWRFWSTVTNTSNSVAALRSSSPLRTPAQPVRGTVCTSWPFRNRAR